jgi:SAM-dependent methyltransferase
MSTYADLASVEGLSANMTFRNYPLWTHTLALPPQPLMGSTGTDDPFIFLLVGHSWAQAVSHYLPPKANVLDIGCGCGKTARFLATDPRVDRYVGFDVLKICVDWANQYVGEPTAGKFHFEHADIANDMYNPDGKVSAEAYCFPVESASIDVALAASLFTHLHEPACDRYLREISRVLKPGGHALVSIHVSPAPGCRYSGTEARIDIDPQYFEAMARSAGLKVAERPGDLCGQEVFVLTPL